MKHSRIFIADIASDHKSGTITGHYLSVARNYVSMFGENSVVAGGPVYSNSGFERFEELPCDHDRSLEGKLSLRLTVFRNALHLFRAAKGQTIVLQQASVITAMMAILLFYHRKSRLYLIQYNLDLLRSPLGRLLFRLGRKKIDGIVCTSDEVGKTLDLPYCVVPDYIFTPQASSEADKISFEDKEYDVCLVGRLCPEKGVVEAAKFLARSGCRAIIAGAPQDESMALALKEACQGASNVTLKLSYISDEEYHDILIHSRYCMLNYKGEYSLRSSGVVYDTLFNGVPVIGCKCRSLQFVQDLNMGSLAENIVDLDLASLLDGERYEGFLENIESYCCTHAEQAEKLRRFLTPLPKVLFIMHLPPPVHGAAMIGQYIKDSSIIRERFEMRCINESLSSSLKDIQRFRLSKVPRLFSHLKAISKTIREFRPDLVYYTPGTTYPETRYYLELAVINHFKARKLIHFHNTGDRKTSMAVKNRLYYRMLFKRADVIFISDRLSSQFDWCLDREQIHICPNGIPDASGRISRTAHEVPSILFLSNLLESKGVLVLLDALSLLRKRGYRFTSSFVGAESAQIDSDRFKSECTDRGIEDVVTYEGKKYGAEKETFFAKSDIFAFPSFTEAFGLVNVEAMQHGLPVVTTEVGGIPDQIKDGVNGFLVQPDDPQALADKLALLLEDSDLRARMGAEGYSIYRSNYTLNAFEQRMSQCIQSTIEKD